MKTTGHRRYGPDRGSACSANQVPTAYPISKERQIERIKQRLSRPTKFRPGSWQKNRLIAWRSRFGVPIFMPGDYTGPHVSHSGVERDAYPMDAVELVACDSSEDSQWDDE